jgi:hypothetical protein
LANWVKAIEEKAVVPEWNRILTHNPVSFENSPQEIADYLRGGPMPECSVCPEKKDIIEPWQLSFEDVQRVKKHISQRIQKAA